MKYLFYGSVANNSGPDNVNRGMIEHLSARFCYAKSTNKYAQFAEALIKLVFCHTVVVSGVSRKGALLVTACRLLRKKSVYIMHGCGRYERMLNGLPQTGSGLQYEAYILEHADLLLPVSERFMEWVKNEYPQYAHKTSFLNNGIDLSVPAQYRYAAKKARSLAVVGGMRAEKNNKVIVDVVGRLMEPVKLDVFGYVQKKQKILDNGCVITCTGKLAHDEFLRKLSETNLFVLNSLFESFSVATIEALLCGCSALVSERAGVSGLLTLEECDIIHNPMDMDEISQKIDYLLDHPNNERILSKLNLEEYTYPKSVERLEKICGELANRGK